MASSATDGRCCQRTWPADAPADRAPVSDPAGSGPGRESRWAHAAASVPTANRSHTWLPARWASGNGRVSGRRQLQLLPPPQHSAGHDDGGRGRGHGRHVDDHGERDAADADDAIDWLPAARAEPVSVPCSVEHLLQHFLQLRLGQMLPLHCRVHRRPAPGICSTSWACDAADICNRGALSCAAPCKLSKCWNIDQRSGNGIDIKRLSD